MEVRGQPIRNGGQKKPSCPGVQQGPLLHQDRELVLKTLSPQEDGGSLKLRVHASS